MPVSIPSPLKIAQLACYRGNIGDNANIVGTRALLADVLGVDITYTNLDILDYLWGNAQYDDAFLEIVNQHDLLLVGGGGFFELTRDDTCSGTALDIPLELFEKIAPPVVFYALGVDRGRGVTPGRLAKFKRYLDGLLANERCLVSVRNDGAIETIADLFGPTYARGIHQIPDGGFFTVVNSDGGPELIDGAKHLGLNLAGDMLVTRFPGAALEKNDGGFLSRLVHPRSNRISEEGLLDADTFLTQLAGVVRTLLESNNALHVLLFPHTYKDIAFQGRFIERLGSQVARRRVTMAPYILGEQGQAHTFGLYKHCDLVLGMRFHANVCSIGLGVPTIGLVSYPQIQNLYESLGMGERTIGVSRAGFQRQLRVMIERSLAEKDTICRRYGSTRAILKQQAESFVKHMADAFFHD